jgi:hypothetical protein
MFVRALIASLALFASSAAFAADETKSFDVPMTIIDNRVFIDVMLNGRGLFHFILDTGAPADMSETVAHALGLPIGAGGENSGVGAAKRPYGTTVVHDVTIGGLTMHDLTFTASTLEDMPPVFGTDRVDGVIGQPVFEHSVVTFDYAHRRLTFTPPDRFTYAGPGAVVPFKQGVAPIIPATLDGVSGQFGVDTGARSAMLLFGPFCAKNNLAQKYGATLEGVTGWGIGGPIRSLLARAHTLTIGDQSVHDLVVRLSTQKAGLSLQDPIAGLIGPDVLAQFVTTFDYARSRIIFEKSELYGRHDSYDRAGVWMGQAGGAFTAIDVIKGSPADAAGVKTGDTILAIDGAPTSKLDLPGVREQMRRRAPGTEVKLLLRTGSSEHAVTVKLRDLV